jgi:hypothetical protein
MACKYHAYEFIVDSLEWTWFLVVGCTRSIPSQYKWRLAKDWEATIERAITVIIMLATKQN